MEERFNFILNFAKDLATTGIDERGLAQLRALWTAYCLEFELEPDTKKYDDAFTRVFDTLITKFTEESWSDTYDKYDLFFGELLS